MISHNKFFIMNSKSIFAMMLLGCLLALAAGCSKNNGPSFTWNYGYSSGTADSAFSPGPTYSAPINNSCIDAYASMQYIQIAADAKLAVGSYPLGESTTPAYMVYYSNSVLESSKNGTVKVTYNNGSNMSGNFSCTFTDGTSITGSFSNIPIR